MFKDFFIQFIKGIVLALVYFEITNANDTTFQNVILFTSLYLTMIYGAQIVNIDKNVVTSAFITKAVFTLVDERIKKKKDTFKN
jgi:hypothetical protein